MSSEDKVPPGFKRLNDWVFASQEVHDAIQAELRNEIQYLESQISLLQYQIRAKNRILDILYKSDVLGDNRYEVTRYVNNLRWEHLNADRQADLVKNPSKTDNTNDEW